MSKHVKHPPAAQFDFSQDRHLRVYVCARVAEGAPVLYAGHDSEGDWQFLCGGPHGDGNPEDPGLLWCLEHVVAQDPSLNALASMGPNHSAERDSAGGAWTVHDETEDFILRCVEDPGWAVMQIPEDDEGPGFAYTVGLHARFGHPELICFGLRPEVMHAMLNDCGARVRAGEHFTAGVSAEGVLEGFAVRFHEVRAKESFREHMGYANWFYGRKAGGVSRLLGRNRFPLLQLLWPDPEGRFPGEPGASSAMDWQQPVLP